MYVEDNGNPIDGQPVDRAAYYVVREAIAPLFCADPSTFSGAFQAQQLDSGNFVVQGG
jgi:hypothetical protein